MVASDFSEWINNILPIIRERRPNVPDSISVWTAWCWLLKLGFDPCSTKKVICIDGYKRNDIENYTLKIEVILLTHTPLPFCKDEQPTEPSIGP